MGNLGGSENLIRGALMRQFVMVDLFPWNATGRVPVHMGMLDAPSRYLGSKGLVGTPYEMTDNMLPNSMQNVRDPWQIIEKNLSHSSKLENHLIRCICLQAEETHVSEE